MIGLYFGRVSDPQYVFGEMVDQVFDKAENIFSVDSDYYMGDSFQIEGTLKMELSSEEYRNKSATDVEFKKKNQMLANLSKMDTTYLYQQNKENGQAYFELNQKIGEEEIFAGKYYINNSTQYFFVNKVLSNYVNDGNNNYFESYGEEITTIDNISYLYHFMGDSIKNHITKEQLKALDTDTMLGEETIKAGLISYRITDKEYKRLLKAVLKDLKSDARASQILSLRYPHLDDLKVDTKKKYLKSNESYTINIYVSKPFYQIVKYEVVYLKDDTKNIYTYEGDLKKGYFYYSENNELKYRADYQATAKKIDIVVYDRLNKEIGTIKEEKDKNNLMFTATLDLIHHNYDITYISKNKDLVDRTYTREDTLDFKIMEDKVTKLQGKVELISKIQGEAKIMEDTDSSVLRSSLTDEENEKLEKLHDTIKERLEK